MFPGHRRETSAAAFQLLALVEQYELDTATLLDDARAAGLYARWTANFEEMRLIALSVPDLHLAWLHVLISRAELVHLMWRANNGQPLQGSIEDAAIPHQDAVTALRNRAMRMIRSETARLLS